MLRVRLRAVVRLGSISLWTLACYLLAWAVRLALPRNSRRRRLFLTRVVKLWGRGSCRILGIRRYVSGQVAPDATFLVSNHLSYVDILVLAAETGCRFVAKSEIAEWTIFGPMCRVVDTWFVDRRNHRRLPELLAAMRIEGAASGPVVLFAEGTTGPGHQVLRFRSPLLELPVGLGQPVHWVTLSYRVAPDELPAHISVAWWAEMPLLPHLSGLLRLSWVEARITFGNDPVQARDRKQLAAVLWNHVACSFEPMVSAEEIERIERLRHEQPELVHPLLRPRRETDQPV